MFVPYCSNRDEPLNAAYYSRFYKLVDGDAMGRQARKRSFNDDSMWAARTTQPRVSGLKAFATQEVIMLCGFVLFLRLLKWHDL